MSQIVALQQSVLEKKYWGVYTSLNVDLASSREEAVCRDGVWLSGL